MDYQSFWRAVTIFGDVQYWIGITVASLVIYALLPKKDKHRFAWIVLAMLPSILISYQVVLVLKNIFEISRPCFGLINCPVGYSFPSGHAAIAFAFATIVTLIARKKILSLILLALAVLVALSRVFLNYHTYSDIMAGAIVGIFISYLFYISYNPIHKILDKRKIIN